MEKVLSCEVHFIRYKRLIQKCLSMIFIKCELSRVLWFEDVAGLAFEDLWPKNHKPKAPALNHC